VNGQHLPICGSPEVLDFCKLFAKQFTRWYSFQSKYSPTDACFYFSQLKLGP
jgi:hypothetical protein